MATPHRPIGLCRLFALTIPLVHFLQNPLLGLGERPRRHDFHPLLRYLKGQAPALVILNLPCLGRTGFTQFQQKTLQGRVVGIDAGRNFPLVKEDLSEKNNYPSKSEEYMANQVFYQIFFG